MYSDSNESEKIKVLSTNDYIYTENYNPSSAYTKVIVRDENLNLYEGYVKTSNITASKDSLLWLSSDNESERNWYKKDKVQKNHLVIDENSERVVQTMTINEKGTYIIKIVSDDGSLISSYKFTKNDPLNQTTKIILICVAIGVVVLVVLFLLIRRKGKYR